MDEIEIRERVRVRETAAQLLDDENSDIDRERDLFFCTAVPDRAEVAALHEVHCKKQFAAYEARIENGNQIPV